MHNSAPAAADVSVTAFAPQHPSWFARLQAKWWLLLVASAVFLLFLGSRGLNEPDEGRYAEIGREMAVTGEWWVPHLNGFPHFQKPPILYWATAASISALGANEWAARLPSALAALATVMLTAWVGRELFGRPAGILAGFILLSSLGFFVMARVLTPDVVLTFWITASIAAFVRYTRRHEGTTWALVAFACMGLGFLTKGPMAYVIPLAAMITWQCATRGTPRAVPVPWLGGMLLALGLGVSWFEILCRKEPQLYSYFLHYELLDRFSSSHHGRSKPFWFFFPVILAALLPWVYLLPALIKNAWIKLQSRSIPSAGWLLLGWTIPPFLILSLSGSKLPTYILPLLPAFALAAARHLQNEAFSPRRFFAVAGSSTAILLLGTYFLPLINDRMGAQASVRQLARTITADPSLRNAPIYSVEIRAHGLEFYLQRLSHASREQADLVLPTTPAQNARLISNEGFKATSLLPQGAGQQVAVVTRTSRARKDFPPAQWERLQTAGDFVLLKSR